MWNKDFIELKFRDNVGQSCLYAFEWTTLFLKHAWKTQEALIEENKCQIIEAQAIFLTVVLACDRKKKSEKAFSLVIEQDTLIEF